MLGAWNPAANWGTLSDGGRGVEGMHSCNTTCSQVCTCHAPTPIWASYPGYLPPSSLPCLASLPTPLSSSSR
eukprot:215117-Chlamydomonas_euryale.AAC.1